MNLSLSKVEASALADIKKVWSTATADFKAEVAGLAKTEMGLIAAHPWIYTAVIFTAGVAVTLGIVALTSV